MFSPYSEVLRRSSFSLGISLPKWEIAMGCCFHFELLVRLLAGKRHPSESVKRDIADGKKGPGLLSLLFETLSFSEEEAAFLSKCNKLRNKLIHCEPDAVALLIQQLVPEFNPPNLVNGQKFPPGPSGAEMLEALKTQVGVFKIQSTSSMSDGFFGWMIQAAADGTFELATRVLLTGIAMLDSRIDDDQSNACDAK